MLGTHRDLLQLGVVNPQPAPVGDDLLTIGVVVVPAKTARALQRQRAAALAHLATVGVVENLDEVGPQAAQFTAEALQPLQAGFSGRQRRDGQQP